MKLTTSSKIVSTVCAIAIFQLCQFAHAAETIPGVAEQPATYFYTGKPYDSDLGSYTFNARNYNPEINRWTSADPSGFPDGANNLTYTNSPTYALDSTGLAITKFATMSHTTFWGAYSTYKYGEGGMTTDQVYAAVGGELNDLHVAGGPNGDYYNSCALRLDVALYSKGIRFPNATFFDNGNFGDHYIIQASSMRNWLSATDPFKNSRSDRTLGAGAQGINSLMTDLDALEDQLGHPVSAILAGSWHVGVITSKGIGYRDPNAFQWLATDAPKVWVLE